MLNIEIKSPIKRPNDVIELLKAKDARNIGVDHQIDTYFYVNSGRLKIRQGDVENYLVYYQRPETKELKRSEVNIQELSKTNQGIYTILEKTHGIIAIVEKYRNILFIDNVKFHIDKIEGLGSFVEIEANDHGGIYKEEYLQRQCDYYINYLGLDRSKFIDQSYSDLIGEYMPYTEEPSTLKGVYISFLNRISNRPIRPKEANYNQRIT